ncbi:MAG: PD-(D/E)XK nuclease family protein, partial [Bacteroidota bacterium]
MKVIFGLALDQSFYPLPTQTQSGILYLGKSSLLRTLENHLGLSGQYDDEFLRVEQFRQLLFNHLQQNPDTFYAQSFRADQFATAEDLLLRRDELLEAGFDFQAQPGMPPRLSQLIEIELLVRSSKKIRLSKGLADRVVNVLDKLAYRIIPFSEIHCVEPLDLLPVAYQRILRKLETLGVKLVEMKPRRDFPVSDLGKLQRLLSTDANKQLEFELKKDGSLLLVRGKRDTDLAAMLAGLFRKNPNYQPLLILSGPAQVLDNSLIKEGLPGLGVQTVSLSRPALQLLKLATSFLWNPLDPYKVLEFVSLSIQPLEKELAYNIAQQIAQSPGLQSDAWNNQITRYFRDLEEKVTDKNDFNRIKRDFEFWFNRKRYPINGKVPKEDAVQLFAYLELWANQQLKDGLGDSKPVLLLALQAGKIRQLLEELSESELTPLDLERVVRTIYEPAPLQIFQKQRGALPIILQANGLWDTAEKSVWWNFVQQDATYFFAKWYQPEIDFLGTADVYLESPQTQNQRQSWQNRQAILNTQKQLILILPEIIEGQDMLSHDLMGDMEASLIGLEGVTFDIDNQERRVLLENYFALPEAVDLAYHSRGVVRPFLQLKGDLPNDFRPHETITSLESLFYYPHQWVFRYMLKLRQSPILSIVEESTLLGNLAHRLIEILLQQPNLFQLRQQQVENWIAQTAAQLFQKEGAILLLYGKEPVKVAFTKKMQFAAWSLLVLLKNNNWEIEAIEKDIGGRFVDTPIKGRLDLLLKRGQERAIIDLKWRGWSRRKQLLKNLEDLQLVLYTHLLGTPPGQTHSGYYILSRGQLLARDNYAFKEVTPISPDTDMVE